MVRRRRLAFPLILGFLQQIGQLIQSGEFFHRRAAVAVVSSVYGPGLVITSGKALVLVRLIGVVIVVGGAADRGRSVAAVVQTDIAGGRTNVSAAAALDRALLDGNRLRLNLVHGAGRRLGYRERISGHVQFAIQIQPTSRRHVRSGGIRGHLRPPRQRSPRGRVIFRSVGLNRLVIGAVEIG